jgi:low molecular weight protein-tyrosine phosphatase
MKRTLERVLFVATRRLDRPIEAVLKRPRVRARLQRRARRAWRATATPLIPCYGNINRSAFAAALARERGREGARSAGFYPVPDRPAPDTTVACAAAYGVELSSHRSARVTRDDTSRATAIFVFDLENLARVAALDPRALARTHFVGALDDDQHVLIADPHGHGKQVLARTLARIAQAIEHADAAA